MKDIVLNVDNISSKAEKTKKINDELNLSLSGIIQEIEDKHNQLCFAWNKIGEFCPDEINRHNVFGFNELEELGYRPFFCAKFDKSFIGKYTKNAITLAKIIEIMDIVITRLNEWAEK